MYYHHPPTLLTSPDISASAMPGAKTRSTMKKDESALLVYHLISL